jgi:hypothetical protein
MLSRGRCCLAAVPVLALILVACKRVLRRFSNKNDPGG